MRARLPCWAGAKGNRCCAWPCGVRGACGGGRRLLAARRRGWCCGSSCNKRHRPPTPGSALRRVHRPPTPGSAGRRVHRPPPPGSAQKSCADHPLQDLRLGARRVAHDAHVDVPAQGDALARLLGGVVAWRGVVLGTKGGACFKMKGGGRVSQRGLFTSA